MEILFWIIAIVWLIAVIGWSALIIHPKLRSKGYYMYASLVVCALGLIENIIAAIIRQPFYFL